MNPNQLLEFDHGVHLVGTILWFDPSRKRDMSLISNARHRLTARHNKILWGDVTAKLAQHIYPHRTPGLICPYGQRFSLGPLSIELFPSGYMLGATQFRLKMADGRQLLYSGPFSLKQNRTAEKIEFRSADIAVVDATFGHPQYKFGSRKRAENQITEWVRNCHENEQLPTILVTTPGQAQDLIHLLGDNGFSIRAHRSIHAYNAAYLAAGIELPACKQFRNSADRHEVLLWPSHLSTSPLLKALDRISISAVSGMGCIPGVAQQLNIDAVFSWSARADHGDLLKYIEKSGATTVVTYGRHAIELAAELQETHGKAAHALLQSPQMNLALD